jgi:hypothetical protein
LTIARQGGKIWSANPQTGTSKEGNSFLLKTGEKMKDEISISGVRGLSIARLLEEYANSKDEGAGLTNKREAWNIAQNLKEKVNQ